MRLRTLLQPPAGLKPEPPRAEEDRALCPAPCPAVASVTRALQLCTRPLSSPGQLALGAAPWPFSGWQAAPAGLTSHWMATSSCRPLPDTASLAALRPRS